MRGLREEESLKTPNNKVESGWCLSWDGNMGRRAGFMCEDEWVGVKVKVFSGIWIHWWSQITQENTEKGDAKARDIFQKQENSPQCQYHR